MYELYSRPKNLSTVSYYITLRDSMKKKEKPILCSFTNIVLHTPTYIRKSIIIVLIT